jgi:Ase1/PRC1/MAP65 family protein
LLAAHESEIARLEALKEQRAPILALIDKHKSLIKERDDLQASSQDASRLMLKGQKGEKRDPGKLLREEKMRKRITKELPKVEAEIKDGLESWEDEYGRPFLVFGERYLDEMECQAKVVPPPRSKTPSNMNHGRSNSKSSAPPSRAGAAKVVLSTTGLRSKTPTNFQTIRGNPMSTAQKSTTTAHSKGNVSPSRIPSRAPLTSTHGNKSPDRKYMTVGAKNMGPPRLPPPKMKDLFVPPTASATPNTFSRSTADLDRSASIVRQVAPEDPYDDAHVRAQFSKSAYYYPAARSVASSASSIENHGPYGERQYSHAPPPPSRPESRQISGTSNASSQAASAASGSENWETLDEGGSEAEADATETYYAKLRAQQRMGSKRASPGWQDDMTGVKRVRSGREESWEDEGVY